MAFGGIYAAEVEYLATLPRAARTVIAFAVPILLIAGVFLIAYGTHLIPWSRTSFVVYTVAIAGTAALALLLEAQFELDVRGAVLLVYGVILLIASTGRPSWLFQAIRRLGWFSGVEEDDRIKALLALIGAVLSFLGLLIISFA